MLTKNDILTIISLMDLTSLNDNDSIESIEQLCMSLVDLPVLPASLCIYPDFITTAKHKLHELQINLPITTVVNFASGNNSLHNTLFEIKNALRAGAHEIDVVCPYTKFINGEENYVVNFIKQCKDLVQAENAVLKVIFETGKLTPQEIHALANLMIELDVDFLKTSTGKVEINATLASAEIMLTAIKNSSKKIGFKAAGGIRDVTTAHQYINLARSIMGDSYITQDTLRLGVSSLLQDALTNYNNL